MRTLLKVFSFILNIVLKVGGAGAALWGIYQYLAGSSSDVLTVCVVGVIAFILSFKKRELENGDEVLWLAHILFSFTRFVIIGLMFYGLVVLWSSGTASEIGTGWAVGITAAAVVLALFLFSGGTDAKQPAAPPRSTEEQPGTLKLLGRAAFAAFLDNAFTPPDTSIDFDSYRPPVDNSAAIRQQQIDAENEKKRKMAEEDERRRKESERQYYDYRYRKAKQSDPDEYYINTRKFKHWSGR